MWCRFVCVLVFFGAFLPQVVSAQSISLNPPLFMNVQVGEAYTDPGGTLYDANGNVLPWSNVQISSTVDMSTPGSYQVTYTYSSVQERRSVRVSGAPSANQAPIISAQAETTVYAGTAWSTLNSVICTDPEDGQLPPSSIVATPAVIPATTPVGTQISVQYVCTDSDNAIATAYSQVTVISATSCTAEGGTCAADCGDGQISNASLYCQDSFETCCLPNETNTGTDGADSGAGAGSNTGGTGSGAGTGLVPCDGPICEFCDFVQLIKNVVDWLIGILGVIAAIMFIVSGLKLVTSMGDVAAKEKAKNMMINAAIGFMIVLAAWLLIDLFIEMLTKAEFAETWNWIKCVN